MDGTGQETLSAAPAHADPHTGTDEAILYVLACPLPGQDATPAYLLHQVGGIACVLAYTDLGRLVECCGEHQPWLAVRLDALMTDLRDQQLPGPVVNLPLSPDSRWAAEGPPWDLAALSAAAADRDRKVPTGGAA